MGEDVKSKRSIAQSELLSAIREQADAIVNVNNADTVLYHAKNHLLRVREEAERSVSAATSDLGTTQTTLRVVRAKVEVLTQNLADIELDLAYIRVSSEAEADER